MIKIAVCDDEAYMMNDISDKIGLYLTSRNIHAQISRYCGGTELLKSHEEFDILLLDIQMEEIDGMETARLLRQGDFKGILIFITVLSEYVFDSFELQAFDYLLKPLDQQRLIRTLDRAFAYLNRQDSRSLFVHKGDGSLIIPFDDILYCEVINRKIYIHTLQNVIDYYDKLENIEKKLDRRFFKCHRSYLVNLKYVRSFKEGLIHLSNQEHIPVSRLRGQELAGAMLQYMKEW